LKTGRNVLLWSYDSPLDRLARSNALGAAGRLRAALSFLGQGKTQTEISQPLYWVSVVVLVLLLTAKLSSNPCVRSWVGNDAGLYPPLFLRSKKHTQQKFFG